MKDEISLNYYFSSLWNNKIIILLSILLAIIFGYAHNSLTTKYYEVIQEFKIDNIAYKIDNDHALFNLKKIRNTEENFIEWSKLTGQNIISFNDLFDNGTSNIKNTDAGFIYTSTEINKLKYFQLYNEYCSKLLSKQTVISINDTISRANKLIKESGNLTSHPLSGYAFTSNTSDEIKYHVINFDIPHKPTVKNSTKSIYIIYIILFLLLTFIILTINILSNNQKE
tara:strand:+ start:233 stop:910 length:678 start_codon:yes stop_codon:yes gene_type:complete